jgi:hypothetical protein
MKQYLTRIKGIRTFIFRTTAMVFILNVNYQLALVGAIDIQILPFLTFSSTMSKVTIRII